MAHSWLNHINRFDHFMKIFKIWLTRKLPPTHTRKKATTALRLLTVFGPNPSERKRHSAPRPERLRSGPQEPPCRDQADPGPGQFLLEFCLHTVRKQKSLP